MLLDEQEGVSEGGLQSVSQSSGGSIHLYLVRCRLGLEPVFVALGVLLLLALELGLLTLAEPAD